ncbi:MAG: ribosome biogenesis GTP-binding protein YihA/YsxC [Parafilimonas sp.]
MEIKSASYLISSPSLDKCPKPDRAEYAFIGRSNVGKSSLINMICNNSKLAKTSNTPGKTQLINHYNIESTTKNQKKKTNWFLVDLPGYGYAKRAQQQRKEWSKMIEDYLRKRNTLLNIFILIDARHEPQQIDLDFVNDIGEWQLPFTIVFTKADKEKPGAVERNVKLFFEKMKESWQFLPRYFVTSAITKQGKEEILDLIDDCNKAFQLSEKSV